jgi:hypothetical protein
VADLPAEAALVDQVVMPLQHEGFIAKRKASPGRQARGYHGGHSHPMRAAMRTAVFLPFLALCSACSVVPPQAWTFDPTQPQPRISLAPQEVAVLTDRMAELQLERDQIRARIASERDVWQRQQQYAKLHRIGMELSPLERRLAGIASAR